MSDFKITYVNEEEIRTLVKETRAQTETLTQGEVSILQDVGRDAVAHGFDLFNSSKLPRDMLSKIGDCMEKGAVFVFPDEIDRHACMFSSEGKDCFSDFEATDRNGNPVSYECMMITEIRDMDGWQFKHKKKDMKISITADKEYFILGYTTRFLDFSMRCNFKKDQPVVKNMSNHDCNMHFDH